VSVDEALDGLSVDDFWLRGSDGHLSAMRFKCVMRDYLVCDFESLEEQRWKILMARPAREL
jgi:hypothetical protein